LSPTPFPLALLQSALHPLDAVPKGRGWNHLELAGLLPADATLVESAVLVPLVQRDALNVVLTRRTDALRHHAGQVSFPGGRVDDTDAGPVAAALREAREEIGLATTQVRLLGFLDPLATITGFRVLPVVAWVASDFSGVPEPGEVAEIFEVPLDWLLAPENLESLDIDYRGRRRQVLEFRRHADAAEQRIWGVTASILYNLRERIARAGRTDAGGCTP
jgi:8-oxo-dGTP pyrophosphatase MutT (NUDIX family)